MAKNNWFNVCQIVIVYYTTIFIIKINAKNIIFGKSIMDLDGSIKIPVFVPISWLIHDIHSAKLVGQKSDANDMMTSDMTPDINGNFDRQPSNGDQEKAATNSMITNRVSDTNIANETPKQPDLTVADVYSDDNSEPMRDPLIDSEEMRLKMETNEQKLIAKQGLNEELMYEPDVWPKEADPLYTTIEIYEVPGVSNYLGLASNRTTVHKAPDDKPVIKEDRVRIRVKTSKDKKPNNVTGPKVLKQLRKTNTNVYNYNNIKNNNYFRNYVKSNKNKFNF